MNCQKCGSALDANSKFCGECGAASVVSSASAVKPVETMAPAVQDRATKMCPYCGEQILEIASKCRFCGSDLLASAPPLARQPAASNIVLNAPPATVNPQSPSIVIQNVQAAQPAPAPYGFVPGYYKNPGLALFLSFIFPGGGQFYNGHVGKGLLVLFTCWIFGISYFWSLFDAYHSALRINRLGF
ncbi:MAG: TM2 domain-containing protein [Acidobacteria bacterium]|nr:TM2 domain-containing protein [Acidobacteriota bacterium]MBS1865031.1 TM2 domain-containing protein [Acidobacteriota bacterium]